MTEKPLLYRTGQKNEEFADGEMAMKIVAKNWARAAHERGHGMASKYM
eukprot:CAMPEP_0113498020 /NCGR_PEP_ID=MMETSP0014_2-20120614/30930_1 /TAXON_ID=2857 /ORGANISM="Nitzschia sp." /LENGTH=47 /DNA_ID=CAMNT_0000391977 /DNA_START=141 /DNA_END=281 /DNA_ORIENTATION=+ /assembly_acc=CAM_ASM_000159